MFRTAYGRELEMTAHTELDSHKAESPSNHWVFVQDSSEVKDGVLTTANLQEQEQKTRGMPVVV